MEEVLHLLLQELGCAMGDDAVTLLSALQSLDLLSIFFAANLALFMPCYAVVEYLQASVHLSESQTTFLRTTFRKRVTLRWTCQTLEHMSGSGRMHT